ncbi:MAG TPA: fasciclin domain-containing protein [Rhizomicrobium sp.]|nr:fasciclin domain-containing protein [Rhizomicrobium sp.]
MKHAAMAGLAAGAAMMIGGALAAVSDKELSDSRLLADSNAEIMNPMIGGQAMLPDRDIMDNISASPLHSALAAALKDTGIFTALKANGQFTVFAPTNAAFAAATTSPQPKSPDSKSSLARRMSYLIVPGRYDSQALLKTISEAGGTAKLRTAEGGILTARMNGPTNIMVMDERGNIANIAIYDVRDKNGIVHVVDHMLEPGGPTRQVASR